MNRWLTLLAPLSLLAGCIVYEIDDKLNPPDEDQQGEHQDEDTNVDEPPDDTGPAEQEVRFFLTPNSIEVGQTIIAHVSADQEFDYSTVSGLTFYGGIVVGATEHDAGGFTLSITAPEGTPAPSTADILVEFTDGTATYLDDMLAIYPPNGTPADGEDTGADTDEDNSDTDC